MKKFGWFIVFLSIVLVNSAQATEKAELRIYCGITMLKPMLEIAKTFENTHDCKVNFAKGGSGKLMKGLLKNKNGDLFLPGSDSYIMKLEKEHPGLVIGKGHVGFNKAAMLVKKGNPKKVTSDLDNLLNDEYRVIIGSAEKGSIGKETKKILTKKGIYDDVLKKAQITLHSSSLLNAIKADKADVAMNWFAVSVWPENVNIVDALPIDEQYAKKKKLVLAVLKDSKNVDLAQAFLDTAISPEGKQIFSKYGLGN